MILATKDIADKHNLGWGIHLVSRLGKHQIDPRKQNMNIERYNGRSVEYLSDLGVLGPESLLIHCGPQITNREIGILARENTPIAHCPVMNAWAGRPHITPIPDMIEKGITVGLGTDGASTNDSQDLFQAMKICALLHKVNYGNPRVLTAEKVIELSTIDAGRALQLQNSIGSIKVGKKADIIILDRYTPGLTPNLAPTKNLVYGLGSNNAVKTVIIDGKIVMENRKIRTLNEKKAFKNGEKAAKNLLELSGELDKYTDFY
jgi:5-methylthioadenosine/S-adenosylhomocysteine deaminase